ncbi:MAG: prophage LambdaMc01, methyltransferase [Cypionkella sp.]|uniref:site-specific DNA-methyltransferase n=1 Tax=Cypionkella sp. TaxID=2811411 RepID=UPI0026024D35|nr:site-specific DNA-methyltransferase [Cypionkella sp.]MDB5660459.1 prophage LambdaMc01, methyltransferase [Cypionkella sp.]
MNDFSKSKRQGGVPQGQALATNTKRSMPLAFTEQPIGSLKPFARNARRHNDRQIDLIARSIREFGFLNPILIDADYNIIAGHGRFEAAQRLGLPTVPTVLLEHLTPSQVRAYRIADNRIAELSHWDDEILRLEISSLMELEIAGDLDFDISLTGFDTPRIDVLMDGGLSADAGQPAETVDLPEDDARAVTCPGDLWMLGQHRLLCGDALDPAAYSTIMGDEQARMVFTDPPYTVPILGHVRTNTNSAHREFAMGVGEMTSDAFRQFLGASLAACRAACVDGAILMVCMDWRHIDDLIASAEAETLSLINLCVWNKNNGGMGSLYRSKHEMVCIFKSGLATHVNNVELGRHGRYRTNVWDYAGVNTFRKGRAADLAAHPTVKPTALIMDAIKDVSGHGDIVLDPFGGSGSTLLAAEKTGRRARLIELDSLYVDVAIRRWQALTGLAAVLSATGETFLDREAAGRASVKDDVRSAEEADNDKA